MFLQQLLVYSIFITPLLSTNLPQLADEQTLPPTELVIRLKPESSDADLLSLLSRHQKYEFSRKVLINEKEYICLKSSQSLDPKDVIDFKQEEIVEFAEIQYHRHGVISSYEKDPEIAHLWHLNDDMECSQNIYKAWDLGFTGKGITVGIVDELIETSHKDLAANIDIENSYDYVANRKEHIPGTEKHGTATAGFVAAVKGNNFCSVGVAFNSKIAGIGLRPRSVTFTLERIAQSLSHKVKQIDIYSNSWSLPIEKDYSPLYNVIVDALKKGIKEGRQGKGAIYVFEAGNDGPSGNENSNAFLTSIYTISTTAAMKEASVNYGVIGSSIMAASYGGSRVDRLLTRLELKNGCGYEKASGTSYATAISSGIIALTLEANPNLTWRDVQHLIVQTSKKCHLKDVYAPGFQWQTNGAGLSFNPKFGFGLMDAEGMVKLAKQWKSVGPQQTWTTPINYSHISAAGGHYRETYIFVPNTGNSVVKLEHVTATLFYSVSAKRGASELYLTSPSGTNSPLMTERYSDLSAKGEQRWTYMSVHFWGEHPTGWWKLRFRSSYMHATVVMQTWYLTLYGTST